MPKCRACELGLPATRQEAGRCMGVVAWVSLLGLSPANLSCSAISHSNPRAPAHQGRRVDGVAGMALTSAPVRPTGSRARTLSRIGSRVCIIACGPHGNLLSLNGPLFALQSDVNRRCEISRSRLSVSFPPERAAMKPAILRSMSRCRDCTNASNTRRRMANFLATASSLGGASLVANEPKSS
jgi:hypothetical protein